MTPFYIPVLTLLAIISLTLLFLRWRYQWPIGFLLKKRRCANCKATVASNDPTVIKIQPGVLGRVRWKHEDGTVTCLKPGGQA